MSRVEVIMTAKRSVLLSRQARAASQTNTLYIYMKCLSSTYFTKKKILLRSEEDTFALARTWHVQ